MIFKIMIIKCKTRIKNRLKAIEKIGNHELNKKY